MELRIAPTRHHHSELRETFLDDSVNKIGKIWGITLFLEHNGFGNTFGIVGTAGLGSAFISVGALTPSSPHLYTAPPER